MPIVTAQRPQMCRTVSHPQASPGKRKGEDGTKQVGTEELKFKTETQISKNSITLSMGALIENTFACIQSSILPGKIKLLHGTKLEGEKKVGEDGLDMQINSML